MIARYEVFSNEQGQWYWHLKAGNGEVVAQSEAYTTKADAERGAEDASKAAAEAEGVSLPRWAALLIAGIAVIVLNDALEIHEVVYALGVILVVAAIVVLIVDVMAGPPQRP